MRMVFRWFGEGNDTVSLRQIRQIPGVEGIAWALHDVPAGEAWPMDRILDVQRQAAAHGLHTEVVESVNVHEDIKLGRPSRERYIENYKVTVERLAKAGVKTICYNFMPLFDWVRTDLHYPLEDGSTAMYLDREQVDRMDPRELVATITADPKFSMPGWEPERLSRLAPLFAAYEGVTADDLREHLRYFLQQIIPVAERCGIRMALHPDDPPWPVFGLPRIACTRDDLARILALHDSPHHGLTLCSGSLGARRDQDVAAMVREFAGRIPFAHIRNVRVFDNGSLVETSHRTADGTVDIAAVVQAYCETGFTGYVRPDHGRQVWDEACRPGYGLYDRAMGVMYLWGLWDAGQGCLQNGKNVKEEPAQ